MNDMKAYLDGKHVEYFIPENTLNIIQGAYLQKSMLDAHSKLINAKAALPNDQMKVLKYNYDERKKEYCEFQRKHPVIDW